MAVIKGWCIGLVEEYAKDLRSITVFTENLQDKDQTPAILLTGKDAERWETPTSEAVVALARDKIVLKAEITRLREALPKCDDCEISPREPGLCICEECYDRRVAALKENSDE